MVVINRFKEIKVEIKEYIPYEHFNLWYELFKQNKGRFLCNPFAGKDEVLVFYKFDDLHSWHKLNSDYRRLTTPIIETNRGWWKRLKVKLGL